MIRQVMLLVTALSWMIPVLGQCPCVANAEDPLMYDCEVHSLTSVPDCVPDNIRSLTLASTGISINKDEFSRFENLTEMIVKGMEVDGLHVDTFQGNPLLSVLEVTDSNLDFVPKELFRYTPRLDLLALTNCRFAVIPEDTFSYLSSVSTIVLWDNELSAITHHHFSNSTQLKELFLVDNPWNCDCQMAIFVAWTNQRNITLMDSARCASPPELKGLEIRDLSLDMC